jgi:tetratricopeptide (TPR) repeat protein
VNYYWQTGAYDRALEAGERALAAAMAVGDPVLHAAAHMRLGQTYTHTGDYARAEQYLLRAIVLLGADLLYTRGGTNILTVAAHGWLAVALAERGEFAQAALHGTEAFSIAERAEHPFGLAFSYVCLGRLHINQGDFAAALDAFERGTRIAQRADLGVQLARAEASVGYARVLAGKISEGLSLLEQAAEHATLLGGEVGHSLIRVQLSEGYLLAGRLDAAVSTARNALAAARERHERAVEAQALRLHGALATRATPPNAAQSETHYVAALTLAQALGMRPLAAHCRLGLGMLYQQLGRADDARTELTAAADLYRAMAMPYWLAQAEAALAEPAT